MRCRTDVLSWGGMLAGTPVGLGTKRPYVAKATLPLSSRADLDAIFALWYRYKALTVALTGEFSASGSVEISGDTWNVDLSGSYTVTNTHSVSGPEGDRFCYPAGGGQGISSVIFNGSCTIENETTGDIFGTDEDPPFKLQFNGTNGGTAALFRGSGIERLDDNDSITTLLHAEGQISFSVKSTTSDDPSLSAIVNVQRWTENEDNPERIGTGVCAVTLYNLYGSFVELPVFGLDSDSETPPINLQVGPLQGADLPAPANSTATLSIPTGEVFPYGVNPALPFTETTMNRLWNSDGTPANSIVAILNAPILTA